jgi:hypothetical protein
MRRLRAARVPFAEKVFVLSDTRMVIAESRDLSETGMLLCPHGPLTVGDSARVSFSLPGSRVELEGRLVREASEQDRYALAMKFDAVPIAVRRQIGEVVGRGLSAQTPRLKPEPPTGDLLALYQQALAQIEREDFDADRPTRRRAAGR